MSETRFSKLQEWILNRIVENTLEKKYLGLTGKVRPCMYRHTIYEDFFKLKHPQHGTWPKSKVVTVSRSLKNLEEKHLIYIPGHIKPKGCLIFLSNEYVRFLKKIGKGKGLMLIKQINNKKINKEVSNEAQRA